MEKLIAYLLYSQGAKSLFSMESCVESLFYTWFLNIGVSGSKLAGGGRDFFLIQDGVQDGRWAKKGNNEMAISHVLKMHLE